MEPVGLFAPVVLGVLFSAGIAVVCGYVFIDLCPQENLEFLDGLTASL
ncbi:MAG: hypothetical protein AAGG51_16850 [Cyanobacteria bacterium P01_G01_bin.54]